MFLSTSLFMLLTKSSIIFLQLFFLFYRQRNFEFCALSFRAFRKSYFSFVLIYDASCYKKSQSAAGRVFFCCIFSPREFVEDFLAIFFSYANSSILHKHIDKSPDLANLIAVPPVLVYLQALSIRFIKTCDK